MQSYEIVYDRAISDIEEIIKNELIELPEEQKINFNEVQTVESNLDAWDYCFALAIGLAGVGITSSKMFSKYLNDIHKAASGQKGDFSFFQEFLFSAPLFCGAEDILTLTDSFGKHYFHYFCFLFSAYYSLSQREKTPASFQRRPKSGGQSTIMSRQSILAEQRMWQCCKKLDPGSIGSHVSSHLTILAESPV